MREMKGPQVWNELGKTTSFQVQHTRRCARGLSRHMYLRPFAIVIWRAGG